MLDPTRACKVLICDLVGLEPDRTGQPDCSAAKAHVEGLGGFFHFGSHRDAGPLEPGRVHFFYMPDLSTADELLAETGGADYDALICAATIVPPQLQVARGAVRIGAGTGNMRSRSWGGADGRGGHAVLMNTPGINSRATAQMVMKAILRRLPDLPLDTLHARVLSSSFDTGRHLRDFPTSKLEGKRIAILGYGNIGREVAKLALAFGMTVVVFARPAQRRWIESEGFTYAASAVEAAQGADILSIHVGLGRMDPERGVPANVGFVDAEILSALAVGATVVNFDRGEIVSCADLDAALSSGRVGFAAVDADVFLGEAGPSGPLVPYLPLAARHSDRLLLLPHAAADTDHPSRVAGAKLAVDMIFALLTQGRVANLVGDLPAGLEDGGAVKPAGIGAVGPAVTDQLARDPRKAAAIAECAAVLAEFYGGLARARTQARARSAAPPEALAEAVEAGNHLVALLRESGLLGSFDPSR